MLFHHGDTETRRKAKALNTKDTKVTRQANSRSRHLTFAVSIDRMLAQQNSVTFVFDLGFGFPSVNPSLRGEKPFAKMRGSAEYLGKN